eukprot:530646_1
MDLSMFKKYSTHCNKTKTNHDIISNCAYLQRLTMGMVYFDTLCNDNTPNKHIISKLSQQIFVDFCVESYPNLLDDFIHFIQKHATNVQLIQISNELNAKYQIKKCNITKCNKFTRHYRHRSEQQHKPMTDTNAKFTLYGDIIDRAHHHILHLFQIGLRVHNIQTETDNIDTYDNDDILFSCIDKIFEKTRDLIKSKKMQIGLNLERYNEVNKYNLHTNYNYANYTTNKTDLDEMYSFIDRNKNMTRKQILTLQSFLDDNQYDSDAVQEDLDDFIENETTSNIYNEIKDKICLDLMMKYMRIVKLSNSSFSTGYTFFYSSWGTAADDETENLLVSPHYSSLKEEIVRSHFVSSKEWTENIVLKGNEYFKTQKGKSISLAHLYCIILYCDMSELCTDFSSTFRKKHPSEPTDNVKQRHTKYYHFGKGLVETVTGFGTSFRNGGGGRGPFFCGLSVILNIPSFAILLQGPCSTSTDIEIGMIIELGIHGLLAGKQPFFDCSWISN